MRVCYPNRIERNAYTVKYYSFTFCKGINRCLPNPCKHGGVCRNVNYNSYVCICQPGYEGNHCEKGKPKLYIFLVQFPFVGLCFHNFVCDIFLHGAMGLIS